MDGDQNEAVTTTIRTQYNSLSPVQQQVADHILTHQDMVYLMSIQELARRCETSEPTILRFLKKIGYSSFQLFKLKLAQELSTTRSDGIYQEIQRDDTVESIVAKVTTSTTNAINDLTRTMSGQRVRQVVELMRKANRVSFVGLGSSGLVAADAFYKFSKLGLNSAAYQDPYSISIASAHARTGDLFVAISHTGETREVVNCLEMGKERGAGTAAITSFLHSRISRHADVLLSSATNEVKYLPDATISRFVQLAIVDILYVGLSLREFSESAENLDRSRMAIARNKLW